MNTLPTTFVVAALLALLMFPLTLAVSVRRASLGRAMGELAGVAFGDGDDHVLRKRIRAFGNFIEYTPFCLVMLALLESAQAPDGWLWTVGALLVTGRIVHALGMLYSDSPAPRGVAMMMTYAAFLAPAAWLLAHRIAPMMQ